MDDCVLDEPRILRREWKANKPYLPKSTSLPGLELLPRNRPVFTCTKCGFANFLNIPLCAWCATATVESVRAFEKTIPRVRTRCASAPSRVFWRPNGLTLREPKAAASHLTRLQESVPTRSVSVRDLPESQGTGVGRVLRRRGPQRTPSVPTAGRLLDSIRAPKRPLSLAPALLYGTDESRLQGRPQTHKRAYSTPNGFHVGIPKRPIYSILRQDTTGSASPTTSSSASDAPWHSMARAQKPHPRPRPLSLPLSSPSVFETRSLYSPAPLSDDVTVEEEDTPELDDCFDPNPFAFVSPDAARARPRRTLSARISRGLSSPVSALHSRHRAAEMRGALAALVHPERDPALGALETNHSGDSNMFAARLGKLRRVLKRLVHRTRR